MRSSRGSKTTGARTTLAAARVHTALQHLEVDVKASLGGIAICLDLFFVHFDYNLSGQTCHSIFWGKVKVNRVSLPSSDGASSGTPHWPGGALRCRHYLPP